LFERNLTKDEFCYWLLDDSSYSLQLLNSFLNDLAIPDDFRDHVYRQFRVRSHAEYIRAVRSQPLTVKAAFIELTLAHFSDILYGTQFDYQVAQSFHHKNRVYRLYADYIYRTSDAARDSFVAASKGFLTAAWLEPSDWFELTSLLLISTTSLARDGTHLRVMRRGRLCELPSFMRIKITIMSWGRRGRRTVRSIVWFSGVIHSNLLQQHTDRYSSNQHRCRCRETTTALSISRP
jgi:hypothetical protein